jgi:hypothetical protein
MYIQWRASVQFSGSQAAFGTTFRCTIGYRKAGKLPEEGHWKIFTVSDSWKQTETLFRFVSQKTAQKT